MRNKSFSRFFAFRERVFQANKSFQLSSKHRRATGEIEKNVNR
jgi:hypothetical protein